MSVRKSSSVWSREDSTSVKDFLFVLQKLLVSPSPWNRLSSLSPSQVLNSCSHARIFDPPDTSGGGVAVSVYHCSPQIEHS